ncbi:hypothetical protein [Macrococcus brunensis]|uniref:hypothetical protein n=1 Tax=Macrococcus brunensis TaxID=198483 RepID=UPI001EEF8432|nr:hypothetical protein [Macrococcus brunensis]ULG72980.1 hypothetical protein MGG12_05545 [Macrococcus brunensis]
MTTCIQSHRRRTRRTQQEVADMFLTTKPNICNIEKGRRHVSTDMLQTGFERCDDPILLNDLNYEFSGGYTTPTASDRVYDDHPMCALFRLQREIDEAIEFAQSFRLDKRPEFWNQEDRENAIRFESEWQDVEFEVRNLIVSFEAHAGFDTHEMAENRNKRFKMQQRI